MSQRQSRLLSVMLVGASVYTLAQEPAVTFTTPSGRTVHVQSPRPTARFTQPSGRETVPYQISAYDAEQHEGFVRNEDALSNKINLLEAHLTAQLNALAKTVDGDHSDVEGLKETRSKWEGYILVGGLLWALMMGLMGVVTFFFGKDKITAWVKKIVMQMAAPPPSSNS